LAGENLLLLASVHRALEGAFADTFLLAGENMVFVGGGPRPELEDLAARLAGHDTPMPLAGDRTVTEQAAKQVIFTAIYEPLFEPFLWEEQTGALRVVHIDVNSDTKPLAYFLNLRRWTRETGVEELDAVFRSGEQIQAWMRVHGYVILLVGILGACLCGAIAHGKRAKRVTVATAVLTSGATGMLGQLTLLFIYQNAYGRLYETAGALFAVYMLGLAAGSGVSTKQVVRVRSRMLVLCVLRLLMAIVCLIIITLVVWPSQLVLCLILFIYAFLIGFEYAVANYIYRTDLDSIRAAGVLHGMDHLGAAVAALVGGVIILPLVGPQTLAWLLVGIHLVVLAALGPSCRASKRTV
jgi:hypothetical protein